MAREGPDHVVDARSLLGIPPGHEVLGAADNTYRKATAKSLSVAHYVGLDIVCTLCSPRVQAEAGVHLVEDEDDAGFGARRSQLVEPFLVTRGRPHLAVVAGEHGIAGWGLVQVEALQRVHEHGGNLTAACLDDFEGHGVHVLQADNVIWQALVASNGLHAVPPAMVGPTEGDDKVLVGVEACHSDSAHHCLGARHVERNLLVARDLPQPGNVVKDSVVQGTKEKALLPGVLPALVDELLVALVAADVDTVRATDVHGAVPIKIDDIDALRALQCHRRVQV
mmetsp:Transcript_28050/g.63530  ORF Transcript_28050/g.63530 Transcript_28050/m.63530 type:complete len:281 (+) Transcript_28050:547-1389(+)